MVSICAVPSMYKSFHSLVDVPKSDILSSLGIKLELTMSKEPVDPFISLYFIGI